MTGEDGVKTPAEFLMEPAAKEKTSLAEEVWPSRTGFLLAAMGSAIGLGNVWRFPYLAGRYGGGTFLVPFIIALITAGIPLLNLEMGLGKIMRRSPPFAFGKIDKRLRWFGWGMLLVGFVVICYYTVIVAWSVAYIPKSLNLAWQSSPEPLGYFYNDFVGITANPGIIGGIDIGIFVALALTWLCIYFIIHKGVAQVSKVVMITVPLPAILMVILAIRGLTLPGADVGLEYYLSPQWEKLADPGIWLAAYAQVFFTLSLAGGVMIAYASKLPRNADINNNARIVAFADTGFAFFAGIAVFSTLGYVATTTGQPIAEVAASGPALAFGVYPTAIALMPAGAEFVGILFFLTLFTLGIDSAFALIEALNFGLKEAGIKFKHLLVTIVAIGFGLSLFFATGGGYHWLDIVDNFFNEIAFVSLGIGECLIIGYLYKTGAFRDKCNETSEIKLGKWWEYCIRYITPIVLGFALLASFGSMLWEMATTGQAYGYQMGYVLLGGFAPIIILVLIAYHMYRRWDKSD
ncbi:MAG: sodium-dependent transporter [Candidatus Thermoplasmatota archaeon]|nr:sodium-dependent transporter [Candidatus Thermoplasmatota archaeon]